MQQRSQTLTIGALAKATGVTTPTIRYYEEIGLLPPAERSASGQRIYIEPDISRLVFIKRCRDFGFSIERVRLLTGLSVSQDKDCSEVRDVAQLHLEEVRERLEELKALECSLSDFVGVCDEVCSGGAGVDCTIFKGIAAPARQCC